MASMPEKEFEEVAVGKKTVATAKRESKRTAIIEHLEDIKTKKSFVTE